MFFSDVLPVKQHNQFGYLFTDVVYGRLTYDFIAKPWFLFVKKCRVKPEQKKEDSENERGGRPRKLFVKLTCLPCFEQAHSLIVAERAEG